MLRKKRSAPLSMVVICNMIMNQLSNTIIATLMLAMPTALSAAEFYASVSGGFVNNFSSDVFSPNTDPEELNFSDGYALNASLGYIYKVIRIEGEIFQSINDIVSVNSGPITIDFSGKVEVLGLFLNVFWDYKTVSKWTPYIGGGFGKAKVYMNNITNNEADFTIVDEKDSVFALQVLLGATYSVSNNLMFKADYRYLDVNDVSYTGLLFTRNSIKKALNCML